MLAIDGRRLILEIVRPRAWCCMGACLRKHESPMSVRFRLLPLRRDAMSRVLIAAAGTWRSGWCRRDRTRSGFWRKHKMLSTARVQGLQCHLTLFFLILFCQKPIRHFARPPNWQTCVNCFKNTISFLYLILPLEVSTFLSFLYLHCSPFCSNDSTASILYVCIVN